MLRHVKREVEHDKVFSFLVGNFLVGNDRANFKGKLMPLANDPNDTNTGNMGTDLKVGDHVVYPTQGAGVIVDEVERTVGETKQLYLEVELLKSRMRVMVPRAQVERVGLRRITPVAEIDRLIEELRGPDTDLPASWTPRHRKELSLLSEGDIFKIAQLVGTLSRRDMIKQLSATEGRILDDARNMVVTEIAVSRGMSIEDAEQEIDAVLANAS